MPAAACAARRRHRAADSSRAKEGLALINGTQVSTALALHALLAFEPVLEAALVIGALTRRRRARQRRAVRPAHPRAARPAGADRRARSYYRALLAGSAIRRSHLEGDDRVQDPYCLRCQPQVMGACLDQLRHAALVLVREANAVTDNPLVFAADGHAGLRRQLPRRAGGAGRRRDGGGHRRGRRHRRAPHRDADRHRRLAPAAVPHAPSRA